MRWPHSDVGLRLVLQLLLLLLLLVLQLLLLLLLVLWSLHLCPWQLVVRACHVDRRLLRLADRADVGGHPARLKQESKLRRGWPRLAQHTGTLEKGVAQTVGIAIGTLTRRMGHEYGFRYRLPGGVLTAQRLRMQPDLRLGHQLGLTTAVPAAFFRLRTNLVRAHLRAGPQHHFLNRAVAVACRTLRCAGTTRTRHTTRFGGKLRLPLRNAHPRCRGCLPPAPT